VVAAVAAGGIITFSCGPDPVTIIMQATAKVVNTSAEVVLDGGGKVTLSGGGLRRILYQDTCDPAQQWATSHCQDQAGPRLVIQNMAFTGGNSTGQTYDGGGGGAIFDRGGQLTVINSSFVDNRCDPTGPDLGGAAIRALSQYENLPVYVAGSTFRGGVCSNGGALSSIGVSWAVLNSVMTGNQAVGWGANPATSGTPGGGSGGAIYTDGDQYTLTVAGTVIEGNTAREGGGAIFFVSDDMTGTLRIQDSTLHDNPSEGFQTAGYPGIFYHSNGQPIVIGGVIS
jgi:predicted outer membrane repeat protein